MYTLTLIGMAPRFLSFYSEMVLKFTYNTIHYSMGFNKYTQSYNHHHNKDWEYLHYSQNFPYPNWLSVPPLPFNLWLPLTCIISLQVCLFPHFTQMDSQRRAFWVWLPPLSVMNSRLSGFDNYDFECGFQYLNLPQNRGHKLKYGERISVSTYTKSNKK